MTSFALVNKLQSISRMVTVGVVLLSLMVIFGWLADIPVLTSIGVGSPSMKFNTALCFVLTGIALATKQWQPILKTRKLRKQTQIIAVSSAFIVMLIGALTLIQYSFHLNLGIDEFFIAQPEPIGSTVTPGRMAPNTAIAALLSGLAVLLIRWHRPNFATAQKLALTIGGIALLGLLGYLYGNVHFFIIGSYTGMAIHTVIALLLLTIGILCDRPDQGVMQLISGDGAGNWVARRLLPVAIGLPILIGGLGVLGYRLQLYTAEAENALQTLLSLVMFTGLVTWHVQPLNRLDIQRRQTELALQASQARFAGILELANDAIISIDAHQQIILFNQSAENIFGYSAADIIGQPINQLLPSWNNPSDQTRQIFSNPSDSKSSLEILARRSNGTDFLAEVSISHLSLNNEQISTLFLRDISERKQTEVKLAQLAAIVQFSQDAIVSESLDGIIQSWNASAEKLFGYTAEEAVGNPILMLIPDEHTDEILQILASIRNGESVEHFETERIRKDGQRIFVSISVSPIKDSSGQVIGASAIKRDITKQKQAEAALRQSEERQQLAFEASGDGFWNWDIETGEVYLSPRYLEMIDYAADELPHSLDTWEQLIHPDDQPQVREILSAHLQDSSIRYEFDYRLRTKSGEWKWIANYGKVVAWNQAGKPVRMAGIHRDINARKQAEIALHKSEERFRAIFNQTFQFVGLLSPDGILLEANQTALDFAGLTREQAVGQYFWDTRWWKLNPETQAQLKAAIARAAQGEFIRYEVEALGKDRIATIDFSLRPIFDESGQIHLLIPEGRDISDRKTSEEALRQSESTLRSFFDSSPMLMGIVELHDNDILHLSDNQTAASFFGTTPEAMKNRFASEMGISQSHLQQWVARYREAAETQSLVRFEYSHNTLVQQHWLAASISQIPGDFGNYPRFSYIVEDITYRKQAEAALRASEAKFRSLTEFAPIGIFMTDEQMQITYTNPCAQKIGGYTFEEALGNGWMNFVHPDDVQFLIAQTQADLAARTGSIIEEIRYIHKNGAIYYGRMQTAPILETDGKLFGFVGMIEDITERRTMEQTKKDFISVVSHELRTPLTAIHGSLGLIAGGVYDKKPEKQRVMLQIAANQTERLVRLVNDILDLGRLESGKVRLIMQSCDPTALMQQSVEVLRSQADLHHISLTVAPFHTPVWAAPDSIIQTLTNLISNAIKFSPPHTTILISAELLDRVGSAQLAHYPASYSALAMPCVLFKIQDQGRGIPANKLEAIFEQFQQVDASDSREKGGTGLGLAICRSIIQRHNGRIWAASILGQGSTFYFTLPLSPDDRDNNL